MNAVLYYDQDGADGRSVCRYYEWYYTDISTKGSILNSNEIIKFQILIVSYEVNDFHKIGFLTRLLSCINVHSVLVHCGR